MGTDNVRQRSVTSEEADQGMWSIVQLGAFLGVPVRTLYYWRQVGKGPPGHRVGRFLRFRADEVHAWLAGQRKCSCGRTCAEHGEGGRGRSR